MLMAQQAALLAAQAVATSNSSIDVPELSRKQEELVLSITKIETEKENDYNVVVNTHSTSSKKPGRAVI